MWPRTSSPTGTVTGPPVRRTFMPRCSPAVKAREMLRTVLSSRCCWTSSGTSAPPSFFTYRASRRRGRPSSNRTSTEARFWRPVFLTGSRRRPFQAPVVAVTVQVKEAPDDALDTSAAQGPYAAPGERLCVYLPAHAPRRAADQAGPGKVQEPLRERGGRPIASGRLCRRRLREGWRRCSCARARVPGAAGRGKRSCRNPRRSRGGRRRPSGCRRRGNPPQRRSGLLPGGRRRARRRGVDSGPEILRIAPAPTGTSDAVNAFRGNR